MIQKIKKFVKNVPLLGWVAAIILVSILVIFKISESNGHPGYPQETPAVKGPQS